MAAISALSEGILEKSSWCGQVWDAFTLENWNQHQESLRRLNDQKHSLISKLYSLSRNPESNTASDPPFINCDPADLSRSQTTASPSHAPDRLSFEFHAELCGPPPLTVLSLMNTGIPPTI